jgi:hypothetical protein
MRAACHHPFEQEAYLWILKDVNEKYESDDSYIDRSYVEGPPTVPNSNIQCLELKSMKLGDSGQSASKGCVCTYQPIKNSSENLNDGQSLGCFVLVWEFPLFAIVIVFVFSSIDFPFWV